MRDTPLPLKMAAANAFQASAFDAAAFQVANQPPKMSNAVLSTVGAAEPTPTIPPPGPKATLETAPMSPHATVNTPPGAVAGTAPREIRLELETGKYGLEGHSVNAELAGAGGMSVNADVVSPQTRIRTTIATNLAANLADNRVVAQGLLQRTQVKITELRDARLNDRETADLIEFLEWLAQGLAELGENIDRAIANPSEPMFLGAAGEIVQNLKRGLFEAVEKNRARVWEIGACIGTACFLSWLGGENLAHFLRALLHGK
jgi:hypothetical protein